MTFDVESIQQLIPQYLSAADQATLVRELKAIAAGGTASYVLSKYRDEFRDVMLQGDGWRGFQLFLFDSGERRSVRGIVLSNSCDVDSENPRDVPARVVFAPLVRLSTYESKLRQTGMPKERIDSKIKAIREQRTTNIFFLPAEGPLEEDFMVRFDEAHSMPVAAHLTNSEREKLFTLSNTGFYMLVLKLSVHFCRLHENVDRRPQSASS